MTSWLSELKAECDLQKAASSGGYFLPFAEVDRLIEIAGGAEWADLDDGNIMPCCPLCDNLEFEGHMVTCPYSEEWSE